MNMTGEIELLIVAALIGLVAWLLKREISKGERRYADDHKLFIETAQGLQDAIENLDKTLIAQNLSLSIFQEHTEGKLEEISGMSREALRNSIANGEKIVDLGVRITKLETEHNLVMSTHEEHNRFFNKH